MQPGAMLINTGRGGLVDTPALIDALKDGQLGYLGLDVYEEEAQLFFEDRSDLPLQDDVLARLLTFPNVIVTAHQAFLTREALGAIAATTLQNIAAWAAGTPQNQVEGLAEPDRRSHRPRHAALMSVLACRAYLEDPWSNTISATA